MKRKLFLEWYARASANWSVKTRTTFEKHWYDVWSSGYAAGQKNKSKLSGVRN